jgi:uncharacterized protein YecA (UPF0149 family)
VDTRTGEIMEVNSLREKMGPEAFKQYAKPVEEGNLSKKRQQELKMFGRTHIGRNEKCPCGSSKKFKVCCRMRVFPAE